MKKFFAFLLLLLPMTFVSCGDDDDDSSPVTTTNDPEGTVLINVNMGDDIQCLDTYIGVDNNYNIFSGYNNGNILVGQIHLVGHVKGISSISYMPLEKMTLTNKIAAQVGYGYIIRAYNSWENFEWAVYVVSEIESTSGGVLGYTMKVRRLEEPTL